METIQRIITEETNTFADTVRKGDTDYTRMEADLMGRIRRRVTVANCSASKGEPKFRMPRNLETGQIAQVLAAAMHLYAGKDDNGQPCLVILDPSTGRFDTDLKPFYLAALNFNSRLGTSALRQVASRALLLCPEMPDQACEGQEKGGPLGIGDASEDTAGNDGRVRHDPHVQAR